MAKITRKDAAERIAALVNGRTQMTEAEFNEIRNEIENNTVKDLLKSLGMNIIEHGNGTKQGYIGTMHFTYANVEIIEEDPKAETKAPAKKSSRKGPRATYIFYYTDKNGDGNGYEVYGTQGFYDALKFLHSAEVKATRIEIYKKGPNFENDHEDVSRAHTKYWK